jgi:hypothetical protein
MSSARLFLVTVAGCFAVIAWQTLSYPPTYLLASWLWATIAGMAAVCCLAAAVTPLRGFSVMAGAACICHALGRATAIVIQIVFEERLGELGAPLSNYAIAAVTWGLVALLAYQSWSHFVIPWSVARRM